MAALFLICPLWAFAGCPGCCSSHGGISSSCSYSGRIYCNDGTVSPSCLCSSCGVATIPVQIAQTITFGAAPAVVVGGAGTLSASASSGLIVTFSSVTPSTCTVLGTTVTGVSAGTCQVAANQPGNSAYRAASQVTQTISVSAAITSAVVTEFYNTSLDNYFITADSGEAAAIDNGSAGPGWLRTGNTFKSGGSTPVCRFYGSMSPGPNSHFYTVDPGECAGLKQQQASTPATQKRWNYESLDFVSTPLTSGTCPAGTQPIYRAYNNGFARGVDSNHRITSSPTAIQEVVDRGWGSEGVVMCAPQ